MSRRMSGTEAIEIAQSARAKGVRPDLSGADLSGANLRGADLSGADLSGANLRGADLRGADLDGADLYGAHLDGADLRGANLCEANLCEADLSGAKLCEANLCEADLSGANLRWASLHGADLREANLYEAHLRWADLVGAGILILSGLPSGWLILLPTSVGWHLAVGCRSGLGLDWLRHIVESDDENDWPEARGEEIARRRPSLIAALALCEDHIDRHPDLVPALAERWGTE